MSQWLVRQLPARFCMRLSVRVRVCVPLLALTALERVRCFGARSILLLAAVFVLMVIPTLVFVWFAQGLLVKGLTTGAVRG